MDTRPATEPERASIAARYRQQEYYWRANHRAWLDIDKSKEALFCQLEADRQAAQARGWESSSSWQTTKMSLESRVDFYQALTDRRKTS